MQMSELVAGVDTDRVLLLRDYMPPGTGRKARTTAQAIGDLDGLNQSDLLDLVAVAKAVGFSASQESLEQSVAPRGYRLLTRVPRLPEVIIERLVDHFGSLQKLLSAGIEDLQAVEGVGETRARSIREGLSRLAESSIVDRYV